MALDSQTQSSHLDCINQAFNLITEYNKTRQKTKKEMALNDDEETVSKKGNCTSRVDCKLQGKVENNKLLGMEIM